MQCLPYARQRWEEITTKSWGVAGSSINGPTLFNNWTNSRKGFNLTEASNLPAIVVYTGGANGHTAIVERYNSSTGKYHYSEHNGKVSDGLWESDLTQAEIKSLFNTLTYKGCMW